MHSSILLASLALTTAVTSPDLSRINEYPEVALGPLPTDLSVRDDYAGEGACNTDVCLQTWIQSP
ncbi:MAG: hypothetical protein SF187_18145, partial [Deltaproteobacteria bacterium]|nr:hypothetical protein [Deltaproteobacteria bacterium]